MVIANRDFIQISTEKIKKEINNQKLVEMYKRCMENTLDTTIKIRDSGLTFILTGDIPAMWLRDSVCQVRPFLIFAKENEEIESMLIGLSKEQVSLVEIDPYANAFMKHQMELDIKLIKQKCIHKYGNENMRLIHYAIRFN